MPKLEVNVKGRIKYMPITLTPEQQEQLNQFIDSYKNETEYTGWERPELGDTCYFEDEDGAIASFTHTAATTHRVKDLYDNAKVYSSQVIAEYAARTHQLFRNLRRFVATHRTQPLDMKKTGGYTIMYNYVDECMEIGLTGPYLALGDILFETEDLAREAMGMYATELLWYFTHPQDRIWGYDPPTKNDR